MKPKRDDFVYVAHIIEAIESIQKFVKGIDYDEFKNNDLVVSAVIRKFEIIDSQSHKKRT